MARKEEEGTKTSEARTGKKSKRVNVERTKTMHIADVIHEITTTKTPMKGYHSGTRQYLYVPRSRPDVLGLNDLSVGLPVNGWDLMPVPDSGDIHSGFAGIAGSPPVGEGEEHF